MRLQGKVAVITGAGSGMGRAMAVLFAQEGARVVAGEWNAQTLDEVTATVRGSGGEITGVRSNVAVQAEAEGLIETALKTYGRVDVLVNNAGVMDHNAGIGEVSDDIWRRVMDINLNGVMYLTRRAVQAMLAQGGGAIVNIASAGALRGGLAGVAYTTAKHALIGLTRNTAWIYAQKGIRCNAICPGAVVTNIQSSMDTSKVDPFGSQRLGVNYAGIPAQLQPTEIAQLALFLASDEARHINGAIIAADAGWTAG